jgi:nicotinamidase-related amidase
MPLARLVPAQTLVAIVDVQEKLSVAMPDEQLALLLRATRLLLEGARRLGAKTVVTEQYPKGLGATLPEVLDLAQAAEAPVIEKLSFSACGVEGFDAALAASGARAVVVVGAETHVCVYQTVRDLVARGHEVWVPIDGVASRRTDHRDAGLRLCERAGATLTTAESVLFDWLERASGDEFKALSKLMR